MNEHAHEIDSELDRRLDEELVALHASLDRVLDLDAGLNDATLPGRAQTYTDDLDRVLDLEAGLAAILPTTAPSDTASSSDPGIVSIGDRGSESATGETPDDSGLLRFARDLASMPADERLRTRLWLPRPALTRIRLLICVGHGLRKDLCARAHNLARDLDVALDVARDLAHDVALARDRAREVARALDVALNRARARAYDLDVALNLARDVVRARDVALARDLDLDRANAHDLYRALASVRVLAFTRDLDLEFELVRAHGRVQIRALAHSLARVSDLAHDLDRALDLDHVLDLVGVIESPGMAGQSVMSAFIRAVAADRSADLSEEDLLEAVELIERVISDAVGANLEDVDLTGIPMVGVRWSSMTRWPPDWRDRVYRESTKVGPDLWRIDRPGIDSEHHVKVT